MWNGVGGDDDTLEAAGIYASVSDSRDEISPMYIRGGSICKWIPKQTQIIF